VTVYCADRVDDTVATKRYQLSTVLQSSYGWAIDNISVGFGSSQPSLEIQQSIIMATLHVVRQQDNCTQK